MDCSLSPLPAAPAAGADPAAGAGTGTGFEGGTLATGFEACLERLAGESAAPDAPGGRPDEVAGPPSSLAKPATVSDKDAGRDGRASDAGHDESAEDELNETAAESAVVPCALPVPPPVEWALPQPPGTGGTAAADPPAATASLADSTSAGAGTPSSSIAATPVFAPAPTETDGRLPRASSLAEGTRVSADGTASTSEGRTSTPEGGASAPDGTASVLEGRASRGEGRPSWVDGMSPAAVPAAAPRRDAAEVSSPIPAVGETGISGVPAERSPAASAPVPDHAAGPRRLAAHTLLVRALAVARDGQAPAGASDSPARGPAASQGSPSMEASGTPVAAARTAPGPDAGEVTAGSADGAAGETALARWRWTAAAGRIDGGGQGFDEAGAEARSAWGRGESRTEASTDAGSRTVSLDGRASWSVPTLPEVALPALPTREAGEVPAPAADARAAFAEAAAEADLLPQVVKAVHLQWRDGIGEARLRLQPEHLGEVRVQLNIEHGRVVATIGVEGEAVGDWVSAHEQELRAALADQGLVLDRLVVDPDGGHQRQADDGRARREAPRPARRAPSGARFEVRV